MVTDKEIVKVAALARIDLTSEESLRFAFEFEKITAYFSELQKLQLEGEMLLDYPCPRIKDKPRDHNIDIEKLSKYLKNGQFSVPAWLQ